MNSTSMCCFGHKNVYKSFEEQWYGGYKTFYFKQDEANRMEWCYWEEVKNICGNCKKDDCYTCQRREVIKHELRRVLDRRKTANQPAIIKLGFYRHPGKYARLLHKLLEWLSLITLVSVSFVTLATSLFFRQFCNYFFL